MAHNPWKPRYNVGPTNEPDRVIVQLAHDHNPKLRRTGTGSNFLGSHASRYFGPFAAVFAKCELGDVYYLTELRPLKPNWSRWTAEAYRSRVRDVAQSIANTRQGWKVDPVW